jgi:hypothetical protein
MNSRARRLKVKSMKGPPADRDTSLFDRNSNATSLVALRALTHPADTNRRAAYRFNGG